MEPPSSSPDTCPACSRPLPTEHECLHCAMELALEAATESPETEDLPEAAAGFAAFADPALPRQAGRFTLKTRLGVGGMGTVYEAEDASLRRTVALKMIRGVHFSTEEELRRFEREAAAAARLDHSNIVPVYEVGEMEGCPFLAMKLVRGGTLAERLRAGRMSAEEAAALMAKVAAAVAHAHEKGVLHRDLKPSNILVDEHGEPWLTDFGMARLAGERALTVTGAQIGTPHYMSPEQAAGVVSGLTEASDVWALGAMLYQMLSGQVPYDGESNVAIMHEVVSAPPPRLEAATGRERDLAVLVERCLQKEPSARLTGAGVLAEELGRWLRGEPIHSRPVSLLERGGRWARRHPAAVAGAAALIVAAGLLVKFWPSAAATPEPVVGVEISRQGTELHVRCVGENHDDIRLREYTDGLLEVLTNDQPLRMPDGTVVLRLSPPIPLAGVTRIVVDAGAGNDEVHVGGFHGRFPALCINGGPGGDLVSFGGRLVLAPGADLDLDLQDDVTPPGNDGVQFNGGSSTVVTGTGSLTVRCSGRIWIGLGAQVRTQDGALTLEANQQEPANTAGAFRGVEMYGAFAGSEGKGQVTVKGRGSVQGETLAGITLKHGCLIQGGTEGVTTVVGIGGSSTKTGHSGVSLDDEKDLITTLGADLVVSGTGGTGAGSASNNGIALVGGRIEGGGKLTTVTGRGGPVGAQSHGVLLRGAAARIAGKGEVSVSGIGGAENGTGVVVEHGAAIKSRGPGPVTVTSEPRE